MKRNQIGNEGATFLAANTILRSLNLYDNQIENIVSEALAENTALMILNGSSKRNRIGPAIYRVIRRLFCQFE